MGTVQLELLESSRCFKQLVFSSSYHWYLLFHHKSIQHQLLLRNTILILARLMLVGMALTRILTVTWWRKLSSRTNASHILNKPAGHRTRKNASLLCTRTARGSSRQILNVFASM